MDDTEPHHAFDENSQHIEFVDFPYDAIDDPDPHGEVIGGLSHREQEAALKLFMAMIRWIFSTGHRDGIFLRALLVCWIFLPDLHQKSMQSLAKDYDKHKQSFGRWHDDFKKKFPHIKTVHMKWKKRTEKKTCAKAL
jgi:hypothetical protein